MSAAVIYHNLNRKMDVCIYQDEARVMICIHDRENGIENIKDEIKLKALEDLRQDIVIEAVCDILSRDREPDWTLTKEYYYLFNRTSDKNKEAMRKRDCVLGQFTKRRYELTFNDEYEITYVHEL